MQRLVNLQAPLREMNIPENILACTALVPRRILHFIMTVTDHSSVEQLMQTLGLLCMLVDMTQSSPIRLVSLSLLLNSMF